MLLGQVRLLIVIALLIAGIFTLDLLLPVNVSVSVLYVVPIILTLSLPVAPHKGPRWLAIVALTCLAASLIDYAISLSVTDSPIVSADEALSLIAQLTAAWLTLAQMRASERERAARKRAEAERRRIDVIHSVAAALSSTLDLDQVLRSVSESMAALFTADVVAVWLAEGNGDRLRLAHYNSDAYKAIAERYGSVNWESSPLSTAEAIRRRQLLIIGEGHETPPETSENLLLTGMKMGLVLPLFARDRLVGAVCMLFRHARKFTSSDTTILETVGKQVAAAIENAVLFRDVSRQRERLALTNEVSQVFTSTFDPDSIYQALCQRLGRIVAFDSLLITLYEAETETIRCAFAWSGGGVFPVDNFEPLHLGEGPQSVCIKEARPVIIDDITRQHPGKYRYVGQDDKYPISILYVPMIVEDRVIGVIQAQSVRPGTYTEDDVPLLSILANQAAAAIQNARLYSEAVEGRRAMEQANRIKDDFLAVLSHELRTPLTPIMGWTRILSNLAPDDRQTLLHGLNVIERNASFQGKLINDLLDMSRLESGKLPISPEPLDLNAVVTAAVETHRGEAEDRNVQIITRLARRRVPINADPARIEQVIHNLVTNAIKFSDGKGRIIVSTERAGDAAVLTVTDFGQGIDPAFLPHVFEKFRQADTSTSRSHGGLGLGLAIAKSLVEMHGGTISASSDGLGRGATFTVRLPVSSTGMLARPAMAQSAHASEEAGDLSGLRLLIVEDDADTLEMMRVLCEAQGIRIYQASTAEQGLAMAAREELDIVISDISMPEMSGHELARRIRADERLSALPMIAMTGMVSEDDRDRALDAGFNAHLPKPISYARLFNLVRELTRSRADAHESR